ncbi:metal ABC transporter ATP-binding protein [Methylophaga marina]|nr:ABC transporter ATP-binding protein [Methylophaga marina]
MSSPIISLNNVSVAYENQPVIQQISGKFSPGSLTAITGPNGAGKSTLLKTIMGELSPSQGSLERHNIPVRSIGYLPQAADIDRQFPITVYETVLLGLWKQAGPFGGISTALAHKAKEALVTVGLKDFERQPISMLSAGQFQRVLFARLLLQNADVIVLDEPFTAIDAQTTKDLIALVMRWHTEGRTVIAVLHDLKQIRDYFPNVLLLARKLIAWGTTKEVLTTANVLKAVQQSESWFGQLEPTLFNQVETPCPVTNY